MNSFENVQIDSKRVLVNFRVPETLKNAFDLLCKYDALNRTAVLLSLMRGYVSQKGPTVEREVAGFRSMIVAVESQLNPAPKSTTKSSLPNQPELLDTAVERCGNLVKDPISKTWMTDEQRRSGDW
jgi:hypothetical protein